jgi:hypothetical protein
MAACWLKNNGVVWAKHRCRKLKTTALFYEKRGRGEWKINEESIK